MEFAIYWEKIQLENNYEKNVMNIMIGEIRIGA